MNKVLNQSGKQIYAVGHKDSPARMKDVYDITFPKLMDWFKENCVMCEIHNCETNKELIDTMQTDGVPESEQINLLKAVKFYFEWEKYQTSKIFS